MVVFSDMDEDIKIARKHNLYVIEDCAHKTRRRVEWKEGGQYR